MTIPVAGGRHRPRPVRPSGAHRSSWDHAVGGVVVTLLGLLALLLVWALVVWALARPGERSTARSPTVGSAAAPVASLTASVDEVTVGESYLLVAERFGAGERVAVTWVGPTTGRIGARDADLRGRAEWVIVERDPPGEYRLVAVGEGGSRAETTLRVEDGAGR